MKKIISILFLSLFLCNVFIYYPVFLFFKSDLKAKRTAFAQNNIYSEKIIVFKITSGTVEDWEWVEENEFRHKGVLYDIVKTENRGNTTLYYCYADKDEMKLFEGLNHFIKNITDTQNNGNNNSKSNYVSFSKEYLSNNIVIDALRIFVVFCYGNRHSFLQIINIEAPSPPPKCIMAELF